MMTVDSLQRQFQTQWHNLSERQRAAFRGNVTWLLGRTQDPDERQQLDELRRTIQPAGTSRPVRSNSTPTSPRRFHLNATRLELHRTRLSLAETPVIGTQVYQPATAAAIASQLIGGQAQEHLLLLLLDIRHTVTGVHTVHIGTTHKCVVEPGDILRVTLVANAPAIILAHNHPSGVPTPSPEEIKVTRDVVAGRPHNTQTGCWRRYIL
jgi:hypothetical protein